MNTFFPKIHHRKHTPPMLSGHRPPKSPVVNRLDDQTTTPAGSIGLSILLALPVMVALGFVFLLITSAVAIRNPDPHALVFPLSLVARGLTCLLGGLVVGRQRRGYPMLSGLLCGVIFNILLWCLSMFGGRDAADIAPFIQWGVHGGSILLTMLGAKIGAARH